MAQQDVYREKNKRILASLQNLTPYIVMMNPDVFKIVLNFKGEVIPLRVLCTWYDWDLSPYEGYGHEGLSAMLEKMLGYRPLIVLDAPARIVTKDDALIQEIVSCMISSIKDDPNGIGWWEINPWGELVITVAFSRKPELSSNGGQYFYYRNFAVKTAGVISWDSDSSDFHSERRENFYPVDAADLNQLMRTAAEIATNVLKGNKVSVCPCCGQKFIYQDPSEA